MYPVIYCNVEDCANKKNKHFCKRRRLQINSNKICDCYQKHGGYPIYIPWSEKYEVKTRKNM